MKKSVHIAANMKWMITVFIILVVILSTKARAQKLPPPNILWLVSEDNSPKMGCYGDTFATTPRLDRLAIEGIVYDNVFATAPVCAPARSTLITGVYPAAMGTENMRSQYPVPSSIRLFPEFLKKAGYYTTNNAKTDYNLSPLEERMKDAWDESSPKATYKNRKPGQPFFAVFNTMITHESSIHNTLDTLIHNPKKVPIPPYHPHTSEMEHDWAQYYDRVTQMDSWIGRMLDELEKEGLAENTIVFYYSDHGGVLGRSKRFLYESGLKVPLIVRIPKKYQYLAENLPGTRNSSFVSFTDFAPTLLNLADIAIPGYMQGQPFLGKQLPVSKDYAASFRGRMDERLDLSRTIRDKKYRYIRNYMPQKIYGQYIAYLWKAPSMPSWEKAYRTGKLDAPQSAFWQHKPFEELYEIETDPHNIYNLSTHAEYTNVLNNMRKKLDNWMRKYRDAGLIPEAMMEEISATGTIYEYAQSSQYPLNEVLETANIAASATKENLPLLICRLQDKNPLLRYWAAMGCRILEKNAVSAKPKLLKLLNDESICVKITAAEALYYMEEKQRALKTLKDALADKNMMARLQALNVLQDIGKDALSAMEAIQKIATPSPDEQRYDIIAANRIIEILKNTER